MGVFHRILMCPPNYFKVAYEINPWMRMTRQANNTTARRQWDNLHRTLVEKCGARVDVIDPIEDLPDMVFTANAGLVYKKRVYLSQFKFAERQGERAYFEMWFKNGGFEVYGDEECSFEGAGDALFAGNKLFAAYGFRTDARVYNNILQKIGLEEIAVDGSDESGNMILDEMRMSAEASGAGAGVSSRKEIDPKTSAIRLIMCQLINPHFYHIDTCFCPVTPNLAIWHPKAFAEESRKRMENEIELLAVPEGEADRFACNSVVVGKNVVLPAGCQETGRILEKRGFQTHSVNVNEFLKAGGACKCLILNINEGLAGEYREE